MIVIVDVVLVVLVLVVVVEVVIFDERVCILRYVDWLVAFLARVGFVLLTRSKFVRKILIMYGGRVERLYVVKPQHF